MCISLLSKVMYITEKLTAVFAVLAVATCVIATLIFTLGFGIGLGYNYCYVDLKTIKKESKNQTRLRMDKPRMYPYPLQRYPAYKTSTQIKTSENPSSTQVHSATKKFRIGKKELIGGYYAEDNSYENSSLGSELSTTGVKVNNVTRTPATLSVPQAQTFENMQIAFKDIVGVYKRDNEDNQIKILGSRTSTPELQPRRTEQYEIGRGHGMGKVFFDYNNKGDFTNNLDKSDRPLNKDLKTHKNNDFLYVSQTSKIYNYTSGTTSPDYSPVYAPKYFFKPSNKTNQTDYYAIPNTRAKVDEKIAANSGKEVVPVSELDFLRLLSKLAANNKTYSLQIVF